ncbi:MAG: hypothetical protein D3909_09735, partial [Candidatus Electrothrix sp. ATG1]|nr:hypothetical protein [Candidatus Electrothrix sp. ATG1]
MKIQYHTLFQLQILHRYYKNKQPAAGDFIIRPTPETHRILKNNKVVFRATENGCSLYAEIEPTAKQDEPKKLIHTFGDETQRLSFWIEAENSSLTAITDVEKYKPGQECFYFNNLEDHRAGKDGNDKKESPLFLENSGETKALETP